MIGKTQILYEALSYGLVFHLLQVVLGSAGFSDGGAQQLQFDVTKFLVPLLAKYCDTLPRKQLLERYTTCAYNVPIILLCACKEKFKSFDVVRYFSKNTPPPLHLKLVETHTEVDPILSCRLECMCRLDMYV